MRFLHFGCNDRRKIFKKMTMKKLLYTVFAIAALVLSSCSNKVDLYSDEGDTTIVYALLDAGLDTNYFKITHSFVGNVNELAQNYDANNYKYEDIDVTFSGVFQGSSATQTVALDTISKWIPYDQNSTFYSGCFQRYYYTTKKLLEGKEYTVNIKRKADGVEVSATTLTITAFHITKPYSTQKIKFKGVKKGNVEWKGEDPSMFFKSTAAYFDVVSYFHYKELMPGSHDTVYRSMQWKLGSGVADKLYNSTDYYYVISYTPESFYDVIGSDDYLVNNSPYGVQRWFEKFEFRVSAVGEELYNYNIINNSSSAIQDTPNYTNVENGVGLMSSRVAKSLFLTIEETSRQKVIADYPQYGFIYDPNR